MKISYNWLQEHIEEKLPDPKQLAEEIIFHAFEVESVEQVGDLPAQAGDTVFDIKVLPDRAGDCLSHYGMAREVAGLLKFTLKPLSFPALPGTELALPVELQSDLCRRYIAVRIDGVKVGPSPEWLKQKLEAVGQRSINNIVDATNFVLLDSGQPVHAFDTAKIDGGIVVRLARDGETIKLLGGEEKVLKETDLVIADYLGALAIAGVKGGANAEVTEATTNIIIEVANFDAVAVRKTSRRLGLITDASKRFENNLSPTVALSATQQVVALIEQIAGGIVTGVNDLNTTKIVERTLDFSLSDITRLLGGSVTAADIEDVLGRYHYAWTKKGEGEHTAYTLIVPDYRADITGAHDIAEEIGRVIGYDHIPAIPLPFTPAVEPNAIDVQRTAIRAWCIQNGYREVRNYTFRSKGEVAVAYGAKGKDKLRANLSDGLQESYELNRVNAPLLGVKEIKLFEIGTVFLKDKEELRVAVCDKGTIQELSLSDFIKEKTIDSSVQLPLTSTLEPRTFRSWSPYPFITRDVSLWVEGKERSVVTNVLDEFSVQHQRPWYLFDEFSKDNRSSLAFRFIFQETDRTLTDEEVNKEWDLLLAELRAIEGVEIR